jgi:hypothetical protein
MKTIKQILTEMEEVKSLEEVLDDVWNLYVEETGDEEGAEYDFGLELIEKYAADFPDDIAQQIAEEIEEFFFSEDTDEDDEDGEEGDEEDGEEDDENLDEAVSKSIVARLNKLKEKGGKAGLLAARKLRQLKADKGKKGYTLTGDKLSAKQRAASKKNVRKAARKAHTSKAERTRTVHDRKLGKDANGED